MFPFLSHFHTTKYTKAGPGATEIEEQTKKANNLRNYFA